MPTGGVLLRGTLVPFFTNLMNDLGEIGTVCFIFKMKLLRDSMILCKTVSCLHVYLPCCSDILQAPKMCVIVHTSLLHNVGRSYFWRQLHECAATGVVCFESKLAF